ncbi:magnesium/cobalt transporter CorA [soil metagenome]
MHPLKKLTRPKIIQRNTLKEKVGSQPGFLYVSDNTFPPRLFLISYSEAFFREKEFTSYAELLATFRNEPEHRHWIDIRGYGDLNLLEKLKEDFSIHPLQMEDVINDYQRPKVEEENDMLFIVSRMVQFNPDKQLQDDQLSLFTGPNYVLTLQRDYQDCLEPLRDRLRGGKGTLRRKSAMYLAYALLDVVLDHYFPTMAALGDYLARLEETVLNNPSKQVLSQILNVKREVAKFRRIAWPERDKLNEILRLDEDIVSPDLHKYFKDVYDHSVQVLDLIDNYKETTSNLTDLYLSQVSNRMNEVMKVLTIVSTIFIPLSFIAGIYGMNFSREHPETGEVMVLNMPELYHPYGYVTLMSLMLLLIIGQFFLFYKKGWLTKM